MRCSGSAALAARPLQYIYIYIYIYKWHVCPGSNNSSRGDKWERMEVGIERGREEGKVKWKWLKEEKKGW
jgi:hypothetical protein